MEPPPSEIHPQVRLTHELWSLLSTGTSNSPCGDYCSNMAEKCRSIIQDPCCVPGLRESQECWDHERKYTLPGRTGQSPGNPETAQGQVQVVCSTLRNMVWLSGRGAWVPALHQLTTWLGSSTSRAHPCVMVIAFGSWHLWVSVSSLQNEELANHQVIFQL